MDNTMAKKITTQIETITPAWAKEQLGYMTGRIAAGTFRQRPFKWANIRRYSADMKAGKWAITHQGIAFDTEGNLVDGQNRLQAVVEAAVPVQMMVTRNLPVAQGDEDVRTMDTIDLGASRNVWQALQISHGYAGEAIEMASAARNIGRFVLTNPHRGIDTKRCTMSVAQALVVLEEMNYKSSIERFSAIVPIKSLRPATVTAPWAWLHKVHPRKAEQFATDYVQLVNLGRGHPALLLNRYVTTRNLRARKRESEMMSMVANLLQCAVAGETTISAKASDEAHLWLLKLNWPDAEKITNLITGEHAPENPKGYQKEETE